MVSRAASVDAGPASVDAAALAQARAGHVRRCKVTQGRIITVDRDGDPQLEATIEVSRKRPNDTLPVPLEVAFAQHLAANWPGGPTKAPKFVNWGAGAAVTYEERTFTRSSCRLSARTRRTSGWGRQRASGTNSSTSPSGRTRVPSSWSTTSGS
jgi:hypothetical protein